jgi:mono/diheme cytochrome c family protein
MGKSVSIPLCAVLVVLVVAGCAGAPRSGGASAAPRRPAAVLNAECTKCHSLDRVNGITDRTQADWASTVRRMVSRGASLSDAEVTALAAYLANR